MLNFIFIEYECKLEYLRCYVFVLRPLLFLLREGRTRALSSEYKLTKMILQVGCRSYHLILAYFLSKRKSALSTIT